MCCWALQVVYHETHLWASAQKHLHYQCFASHDETHLSQFLDVRQSDETIKHGIISLKSGSAFTKYPVFSIWCLLTFCHLCIIIRKYISDIGTFVLEVCKERSERRCLVYTHFDHYTGQCKEINMLNWLENSIITNKYGPPCTGWWVWGVFPLEQHLLCQ